MKTLNFARNYNGKLDQDIFTTIRKHDSEDWTDLWLSEKSITIKLDGETNCHADLISTRQYENLSKVPAHTILTDTGEEDYKDAYELFQTFGYQVDVDRVVVLTLKRLEDS